MVHALDAELMGYALISNEVVFEVKQLDYLVEPCNATASGVAIIPVGYAARGGNWRLDGDFDLWVANGSSPLLCVKKRMSTPT